MEPKECLAEMTGLYRKGKERKGGRKEVKLGLERFRVEMLRGAQGAWLQRGLYMLLGTSAIHPRFLWDLTHSILLLSLSTLGYN